MAINKKIFEYKENKGLKMKLIRVNGNFMQYKCFNFIMFFLCCFSSVHSTSITQGSSYPAFCQLAAENDGTFVDFKSNAIYRQSLEHIPYELGCHYLDVIVSDYPHLIPRFDQFRENDLLGDPVTCSFGGYGIFSPTTLRYIHTVGDLVHKFGDLSDKHIVEIGGGYGGLCKVLSVLGFASYTLIDLPECNALSKKYVERLGIPNVFFIDSTELHNYDLGTYDLVISNYAFSEIDKKEQLIYLEKLIEHTPNGYMIMNFISHYFNLQSLSIEELISILYHANKSGKVEKERPLTHSDNLLVTWKSSSCLSYDPQPLYPLFDPSLSQNAISYVLSGGRFGDNLIAYFHAKWSAYKYGLPFLYSPFPFSDQFAMDERDQRLDAYSFPHHIGINNEKQIAAIPINSTLLVIPYSPNFYREYLTLPQGWLPFIDVDWEDAKFHEEMVRCLTPKNPVSTMTPPKGYISLGVHLRRGGGVDNYEASRWTWPLKFPPDSYYIAQIQRIAKIFPNQRLYVYIFTDDTCPTNIVNNYKKIFNNPNIIFDCRSSGNGPHQNILEDFFSMTKFDCFIACQSNFSLMATKFAQHTISIIPINYEIVNGEIVVNETEIRFKKKEKIGSREIPRRKR